MSKLIFMPPNLHLTVIIRIQIPSLLGDIIAILYMPPKCHMSVILIMNITDKWLAI